MPFLIDDFDQAAENYSEYAHVQKDVFDKLISLVPADFSPSMGLDLGCGDGRLSRKLLDKFSGLRLIAVDISPRMVSMAREYLRGYNAMCICGDMDTLSLWQNMPNLDFVFSNATLQWSVDLSSLFRHIRNVLVDDGLFAFSIFGPNTYRELSLELGFDLPAQGFSELFDVKTGLKEFFEVVNFRKQVLKKEYASFKDFLLTMRMTGARGGNKRIILPSQIRRVEDSIRRRYGSFLVCYEVGLFLARPPRR